MMIHWHWAVIGLVVLGMLLAAFYFLFIYKESGNSFVPDPTAPLGCIVVLILGALGIATTLAIAGWLR